MNTINVTLPDGSEQTHPSGIAAADVIRSWKPERLESAVAAKIGGQPVDLSSPMLTDAGLSVIEVASKEGLSILRHSMLHVMAQAVQDTFKAVQVAIGPSIEDGFYYDFEYAETFTPEDLEKIERRMREIAAADYFFI
jgi:threonyl-tRNA synthetase